MVRKTVFITGGTGNMGWSAIQYMLKKATKINLKILARKSKKNIEMLSPIMAKPNVRIIWGDFLDYDAILEGVTGSDYVLHIGGLVSPAADWKPYLTQKTNIRAAENICRAVLSQPDPNAIKVCYVGSVAQTGGRNYPIHWGRCGDPLKISIYDHYAVSKSVAERIFVDSGIKNWVVLRQSGILYPSILRNLDPIMYHIPLNGVLEWCTIEDAGRVICNLVLEDQKGNLKSDFWNHFYNVGSGEEYRISNYEFMCILLKTLGLAKPEKLFSPNWFITKNFHGHFFADSDKLDDYLHFRSNMPINEYFKYLASQLEFEYKLAKRISKDVVAFCVKPFMKKIALTPNFGTLDWIESNNTTRINAFFGSKEEWEKIPKKWTDYKIMAFEKNTGASERFKLDHGYDEDKPENELNIEDMKTAAKFRGGKCLSDAMAEGDLSSKLQWKCGHCGAVFEASPALILLGGHWCPECFIPQKKWEYNSIAKTNPFFAQVWYPSHKKTEKDVYDFDELFHIDGVKWDDIKKK